MSETEDPFARHPELRESVADPLGSELRSLSTARLAEHMRAMGLPGGWWRSDAEREALRAKTLAERRKDDLWVFAYGSLMWDPAIRFAELRRAHAPRHQRRFILRDIYGGRGTAEAPGLMAALDHGGGCDGLAFRLPAELVEAETEILWRREMVAPCYQAAFVAADTAEGRVEALTFVADHRAEIIAPDITRAEQLQCLATGAGFLGTSLDYLRNIARKFERLGIEDAEVTELLCEAEAYAAGAASAGG